MRLWTWHEPAFDLTTGHVDHSRSEYSSLPGVPDAKSRLFDLIGTGQVIWCLIRETDSKTWGMNAGKRLEWQLDVPVEEVVAFLNSFVWNRIIAKFGNERPSHPPSYLRLRWKSESLNLPADQQDSSFQSKIDEYDAEPRNGWWSELVISDRVKKSDIAEFVKRPEAEEVTALIRHPVPDSWIVRRPSARDSP